MISKAINKFFGKKPLSPAIKRSSMRGCLERAKRNGLDPQSVFDVGVAQGTPELYELFPEARHILIEPLEEFAPYLKRIASGLERCECIHAAATTTTGKVVINVHPDLVGSSVYKEGEASGVNGVERTVPAVTLDGICEQRKAPGPYLIKVDTQGSELDVLTGAREILKNTELVMLETSLFEFFKGGTLLYEVIAFMENRGFCVYDIFDLGYRPLDGAMSQANIAFAGKKSKFRKHQFYATRKQREEQNRRLRNMLTEKA